MVLVTIPGWKIYQTSTRVGYGTNYVEQGAWMNGATGQQKGADGHTYNYLNVFDLLGHRMFKPTQFRSVSVAYLHFESSGGYNSGTLNSRSIPSVTTKDSMNQIWVESTCAVNTNANSQYRVQCTDFVRKRYNGESTFFTLDLFNVAKSVTGSAWIYIKPFKKTGVYDSTMEVARPCLEIGMRFQFNRPPSASFTCDSTAFAGNRVNITNNSSDPDGHSLTSTWSVSPSTFSSSLNNSGGWIVFNSPGTYTVSLSVNDGHGGTHSTSRTVTVSAKGTPKLDTSITSQTATVHLGTTRAVSFSVSGAVTNYNNSGKTIGWVKLTVDEAQHNYSGSGTVNPVKSWTKTYNGAVLNASDTATITTAFDPRLYTQYYRLTFAVHYSDTNTTDSVTAMTSIRTTNGAPNTPEITYPIGDSIFHGTKPIFLATVASDPDGDSTTGSFDIWNTSVSPWHLALRLNSATNSTNISPSGTYKNVQPQKVKVATTSALNGCYARMYTLTSDAYGLESSIINSGCHVREKQYVSGKPIIDELTPQLINSLITRINDNCKAYGLQTMTPVSSMSDLDMDLIASMITHINSYINRINTWSVGNPTTSMSSVAITIDRNNDSILSILNQIIDLLYQ